MPNWCSIDFDVSGPVEDIARFREAVGGSDNNGETPLDFDQLIPMPSELHGVIADGGTCYDVYYGDAQPVLGYFWVKKLGIETVEALREHFDADPERRATADTHKANIEKYGAPTWYEWSIKYWGTKWNACDAKVTDNGNGSVHFTFDTAWSFPFPIFRKLAADFPMLNFEGLAQEPNMEMFITFEARNGQFTWQDDDEALEAAVALYREEDESSP